MEGNAKGQLSKKAFQNINIPGSLLFVTSHLQGLVRSAIAAVTEYRLFQACYVFCDSSPVWNYTYVQFLSGYPACNLWVLGHFPAGKAAGAWH